MESSRRLLILLAIVYSAVAVPLTRKETCARHCTESNRFNFNPGTTYTYDYDTVATTKVKGTSEERSELQLKAQVDIQVLSKCDFSLRLRNVALMQSDPSSPDYLRPIRGAREFARTAERQILRFSYQDGAVQELCPEENAPAWVTNIQRGILSAFQNTMKNLEGNERHIETDVAGKCSVEYQSLGRSWRGTLTIRKLKDLNACTDRQNADTSLQGAPFTHGSAIQSAPIIRGTQECEQSIGSGILQSSSCTETHVFRPFSKGSGGATTTVTQKLTFVTSSKRTFTGDDYRSTRENLLFQHDKETSELKNDEEAQKALKRLCEESQRDITINVPGLFASFVYRLRKLDENSFRSLYRRVETICPNNPKAKKFFLDAVPVVATSSSVKFMVEMVLHREISTSETNFWFSSLTFVSEPTSEMIATLTPLLDTAYEQSFFGVSTLVHTYCSNKDCSNLPEVRIVVRKLVNFLGDNCFNPDSRKILLALKAIGNVGMPFGFEKVLERCAQNPQLSTEVRVSAIQAYRRFHCDISRETFSNMFRNYDEASEMRIAAYLSIMTCPTTETLQIVKQTLEEERVNQVGSFVWTHLRSLAKSQHPDRKNIKDILSNLYLLNKFESDIRKFSSAKEASFYWDAIDSGLHLDTHLIYPTNSYIPHAATFNLTVDIFGHSCNLLQLDGRMEGMERVIETFFGPNGYFPQKQVTNLLRDKRSISDNKLQRMEKEFDMKSKFEKNPYASMDVKIFGNTLWFSQFQDETEDGNSFNLMDLITELAQKQEKEFSRSFMFLDTQYALPMASGLPLRLALNGTATVALKLAGKFNVKSMQNVDILANIEPSGAIELAGLLTVDAGGITRTGLRIAATLHTSTVLDSKIEVRNGQLVKAQLNMPREKIEFVDVQSKIFLVYGVEEREQTGLRDSSYNFDSCTGETLKNSLGIELCTSVSLPRGERNSPMYPLSGSAALSLYLKKTDPTLTSYAFDASWESKTTNGLTIRDAILSVNTPKSTVDREVSMRFHLSEPDNLLTFDLKSPFKKLGVIAKFVNVEDLKRLDISTTVDDRNIFSGKSELRITREGGGVSYFPTLEIKIPSRTLLSMAGSAHLKHGSKYGGQLTIKELTERPITLKGNLDVKRNDRYEAGLEISCFALDSTTKAFLQMGDSMSVKLNTDYRVMESVPYKFSLNGKVRDLSANALRKYTGVLNMQATAFPEWDTFVSWESMTTGGHFENSLSFTIGDGARSRKHTIDIQEIVHYGGNWNGDHNAQVALKFSYPEKRINYAFEMKHEISNRKLKNELELHYAKNRHISTSVNVDLHQKNTLDFSAELELKYPGRKTKLSTELREDGPNGYRSEMNIQWQEGRRMSIVSHYRNKGDENTIKHEADTEINFSFREPITVSCAVGAKYNHYTGLVEFGIGPEKNRIMAEYIKGRGFDHSVTGQVTRGVEVYTAAANVQQVVGKLSGNVEVKFPNRRRVTGSVNIKEDGSLRKAVLETNWDADRDPSKRFLFDVELATRYNGYDGKAMVTLKRDMFKGFFSTSQEGAYTGRFFRSLHKVEMEWSPRDKITMTLKTDLLRDASSPSVGAQLDVTTLYPGYRTISVSTKNGLNSKQWNSETIVSWEDRNKIEFMTGGTFTFEPSVWSVDGVVKFSSPFKNYENLIFNTTAFMDTSSISNKFLAQWKRNARITGDFYASLRDAEFTTKAKLTTPFNRFSDISGEINHSHSSGNCKTSANLKWAPNKMILANSDFRHNLHGRRRTCTSNLVVSTPFKNYERMSSKLSYNNDGTVMNTDLEMSYADTKKITVGFTGKNQNTYYNTNLEGKFSFKSPIENFENVQISASWNKAPETFKLNFDGQTPYRTSVSFNSVGKMESWNNIELNLVFGSKLPIDLERFSFDFVHKLQNNNLKSTLDVAYGHKQTTVLLTGLSRPGYKSKELEGSVIIKTPVENFEELKVNVKHTQNDWEFVTRVEMNKNRERMILSHNLNVKDMLNVESSFHFQSSLRNFREITGTLSQVYMSDYFNHNSKLQVGRDEVFFFNTQFQNKLSSKNLVVNLKTPFEILRTLAVTGEHQTGHMEYKTKLNSQWNDGRKISFESSLTNYRMQRVEANIRLQCDIENAKIYKLTAKYDVTTPRKTGDLSFHWNHGRNRVVSLSGNLLVSRQTPRFDITMTTPFRNLEKITIMGNGEYGPYKKLATILYERNSLKTQLNAQFHTSSEGAQVDVSFTSPYKNLESLSFGAKYQRANEALSGDMELQWSRNRKISFVTELTNTPSKFQSKATLTTPFQNFETFNLESSYDTTKRKNTARIMFNWADDKEIELTADCEVRGDKEGVFNVNFRSPFTSFRQMSASTNYKMNSANYEGGLEVQYQDKTAYKGSVSYDQSGKFKGALITPHRGFRNVELSVSHTSVSGQYEFRTKLKCERKEVDFAMVLKSQPNRKEWDLQLNTPFENYRRFHVRGVHTCQSFLNFDGELNLVTPFDALPKLEIAVALHPKPDQYEGAFEFKTISNTFNVQGQTTDRFSGPFDALLQIKSTFEGFDDLSIKLTSDLPKRCELSFFTPRSSHVLGMSSTMTDSLLEVRTRVVTPLLSTGKAQFTLKVNYGDPNNANIDTKMEVFGTWHTMTGSYTRQGRNYGIQTALTTSLLKSPVELSCTYNDGRQRKNVEAKLTYSGKTHQISSGYEMNSRQATAELFVECDLLPFSTLRSTAKYVNGNDRDIEMAFHVETGRTKHSIVASIKNYDGEKFLQLKLLCPYLNSKEFSVTGTLKNSEFRYLDGVLTLSYPNKDLRIAANMKRNGWESIEGFLTLNTPFEQLTMLRIDAGFKNDRFRNIEGNVQVETSKENFRNLAVSAKLSRTEGSEDLAVSLKLPNWRHNVQLLGNVHYNKDLTKVDGRLTFSLNPHRYSIFSQYLLGASELAADVQLEWKNSKFTVGAHADYQPSTKGVSFVVTLPDRTNYEVSCSYGNSFDSHNIALTYRDPSQHQLKYNATLRFPRVNHIEFEMEAHTTLERYQHIELKSHFNTRKMEESYFIDYRVNSVQVFEVNCARTGTTSRLNHLLRFRIPYEAFNGMRMDYTTREGRLTDVNVVYKNKGVIVYEEKDNRGDTIYQLQIFPASVTLRAEISQRREEQHIKLMCTNDRTGRKMGLDTINRSINRQKFNGMNHEITLWWEDGERKSISHYVKVVNLEGRQMRGKEFFYKLSFPSRVFEVKGRLGRSGKVQSGGVDFFWDAAKNPEKKVTFGIEHHDLSTSNQLTHKLQIAFRHPRMEKELVHSNLLVISPTEFKAQTELQYSSRREENFVAEISANDQSSNSRDKHYKAEISVRQLSSKLDFKMTGELTDNHEQMSAHLKINNFNKNGQYSLSEMRARIMKLRNEIDFIMRNGQTDFSASARMANRDNKFNTVFVQKLNGVKQLQSVLKFDYSKRALDLNITTAGNVGAHLSASFPDDSASVQLAHSTDVGTVTDCFFFVGLEKSRLLKSRINWRPGMWRDFRIATGETLRGAASYVNERTRDFTAELQSEWQDKSVAVANSFQNVLNPFTESFNEEWNSLYRDIKDASNYLNRMYIVKVLKEAKRSFDDFCGTASVVLEALTNVVLEWWENVYDACEIAFEDFQANLNIRYREMQKYLSKWTAVMMKELKSEWNSIRKMSRRFVQKVTKSLKQSAENVCSRMEQWTRTYAPCIIDYYYKVRMITEYVREKTTKLWNLINDNITSHPLYIALDRYCTQIVATVEAFQLSDITTNVQSRVLFFGQEAGKFINQLSDGQLLDIIRNSLPVDYVTDVAKATLQKGADIYTNMGLDKLIHSLAGYTVEYMKEAVLSSGHEFLHQFYQLRNGAKYTFDPRNGHFAFEYTLPTSSNSIYDVFNFVKYAEQQKLSEFKNAILTKYYEDFCIWDVYYNIKKFLTPRQWLPPFDAHALVAGNQHYLTFDKFSFDFAGECSYLLARDFVDGRFAVVANYRRDGSRVVKKSLTVMSGELKFEVAHDYKVTLDDSMIELPVQIGDTVAIREGSMIRISNERFGFTVICNFVHDVCTVGMSGFYFAKTGGLLGTYDYEPRLDFMTPEMMLATDVETFANSWEIGKATCRRSANMATVPSNDYRVQEKCRQLFSTSTSNFRACFKQVDPEPFLRMCVSDLSAVDESRFDEAICTSSAAYFTECKIQGVLVKMPKSCVRCETERGEPMFEGQLSKFQRNSSPRSADVVFVIEEKKCNEENIKFLGKLIRSVDDNFKHHGFEEIRYRIVGFGGDGVHAEPHIHTIDGKEYGSVRVAESDFKSLQIGDGPSNVFGALRFAASLNYHPGSSKSFILLKCSPCEADENREAYGEVLRTLIDGEISLHLLMEQKYEMRIAKNSKAKKVIGLDKDFAYTMKDVRDATFLGDRDLLIQLKIPKDICVPLALEVNGSTFDSQYLTETKRNNYKKFMDALSRRVVTSATQASGWTMCCECIADDDGVGKSTCQRCVTQEVANMISAETFSEAQARPESRTRSRRPREKKRESH